MTKSLVPREAITGLSNDQRIYIRYLVGVLLNLAVLGLVAEYWQYVTVESFTVILLVALLLQVMLKLTVSIEHKISGYFSSKKSVAAKTLGIFFGWLVLSGSKFVILGTVNFIFGDAVVFSGPYHGVVAFFVLVVLMVITEKIAVCIFKVLADAT